MKKDTLLSLLQSNPARNRVGVVALSMPSAGKRRSRVTSALKSFRTLGLRVEVGKSVYSQTGYKSMTARERARDLQRLLCDDRVRVIFNTTGGYNSNEVIEYLDWSALRAVRDKIFVGYSDITAINLALARGTSIQVVQGPMLVDYSQDPESFTRFFAEMELADCELSNWPRVGEYSQTKLRFRDSARIQTLDGKRKSAEGRLVTGNLSTFNLMLGTPWMPSLRGAVLFLEYDKEEATALPSIERMLWQLRLAGVFDQISGLVFGQLQQVVQDEETRVDNIRRILSDVTDRFRFPVLYGAQFGHIYPSWYLRFGARVRIFGGRVWVG